MKLMFVSIVLLLVHINYGRQSLLWYLAAFPMIYAVLMLGVIERRIGNGNRANKSD